jgi:hypothetical protein
MSEARPGRSRPVSLAQVIVILVGLGVTLLGVLFVFGITIGAVSGFPATATLLIPALIFLALAVLLFGSALGLRRFGPPVWWVATIVSALMLITMLAVMAITAQTPLGLLLATLVSGGALGYLLVEREEFRKENAAESDL